jgi:leucyl aminopeptidase
LTSEEVKVNVVGILALSENVIGSHAQRPSDIVKSMSGQTVEVLNTDAEGRLVLGDVLYYTQTTYKPKKIIDYATLTGAILVALGTQRAGLFSNCDDLANDLLESGKKTGELSWRMPMSSEYDEMINSDIADMKNVSNTGYAGSITAAQFLKRFINGCKSWAHLDIAGTAYRSGSGKKNDATAHGVLMTYDYITTKLASR